MEVPLSATHALLTIAWLGLGVSAPATASEELPDSPNRVAVGLEVDLLPTVLSAFDGKLGEGGSAWVGYDRLRLRFSSAQISFPAGFLTPPGFKNRELTALAGIADYFFLPEFRGPWLGAGFEYWWNTANSPSGPGVASWQSSVFTLGGGFVWRVVGNLYLNPWAAAHLLLSRPEVALYGASWAPGPLSAEVSLKVGWFFHP